MGPEPAFQFAEPIKDRVEFPLDLGRPLPTQFDKMGLEPVHGGADRHLRVTEVLDGPRIKWDYIDGLMAPQHPWG